MKTPVLIPAHNEALYIGQALGRLDPTLTDPLVIVNGDQADNTTEIVKGFGVTVLSLDEQGKLPAQQMGMRYLGKDALNPVLFLDADSYPLFPSQWPGRMLQRLDPGKPSVAVGPVIFEGGSVIDDSLRSLRSRLHAYRAARNGDTIPFGSNMALHMKSREVLDVFLDLPHIWAGDDFATRDVITSHGGTAEQIVHPKCTCGNECTIFGALSESYWC